MSKIGVYPAVLDSNNASPKKAKVEMNRDLSLSHVAGSPVNDEILSKGKESSLT